MKAVLVLALCAIVAISALEDPMRSRFREFQTTYNKAYANQAEFNKRFNIFKANMAEAERLTAANKGSAQFGVTKFSDMTPEEFKAQYLIKDFNKTAFDAYPTKTDFTGPASALGCSPAADKFNWADCGATTPVKNQGQCGSCWAFSATETIESYYAIGGNTLTAFSVEQIVDCDTAGEDQGCNGGFPSGAYEYIQGAGGIETEADYPYTAESGESGSCQASSSKFVATVTGVTNIDGETGLYSQTSTASGGPVSICVDASTWSSYQGGILTQCGNDVDHCVQLVGYANYGGSNPYWIVRNSWGTDWGEQGYIYVAIGQDLCSIGDYATVVTAGPAQ